MPGEPEDGGLVDVLAGIYESAALARTCSPSLIWCRQCLLGLLAGGIAELVQQLR